MYLSSLQQDFERDGFCVVPQLLSAEQCEQLKAEAQQVLHECGNEGATVFVGAAAASPMFYDLADDSRVVAILRELMGDGVAFLSDKIVFKSSKQTFATPWHCDAAYWPNTRPKISVWIALDEVSQSNGALKVLPRSHTRNWNHASGKGAGDRNEFENNVVPNWDSREEFICTLPQGGAIFFSDRLLHASCENTIGTDRFSIISTYHAAVEDEPFDLHFSARHVVP
jgi:ectoine hydroxylase-related dioxygenase (phytanoyl-CoA dioxygenase family)